MPLFQIKHRFSLKVLFEKDCYSMKLCLEAAIRSGADLRSTNLGGTYLGGAYLRGADLGGADLRSTNLGGAYLGGADLRGADLGGADLIGAYLRGADLGGADLRSTNLGGAYLRGADLRSTNLGGAYLRGAYLGGADLGGAYLGGADGISPEICTPLLILLDQPGRIRAYKLVNKNNGGPYQGGIKYEMGKETSVDNANTDINTPCGAGINLATLDWCIKEWRDGYKILIAEFEAKDIAAIPTATDGKFRCHRCKIVGEKDLKEIGLIMSDDKN